MEKGKERQQGGYPHKGAGKRQRQEFDSKKERGRSDTEGEPLKGYPSRISEG